MKREENSNSITARISNLSTVKTFYLPFLSLYFKKSNPQDTVAYFLAPSFLDEKRTTKLNNFALNCFREKFIL